MLGNTKEYADDELFTGAGEERTSQQSAASVECCWSSDMMMCIRRPVLGGGRLRMTTSSQSLSSLVNIRGRYITVWTPARDGAIEK